MGSASAGPACTISRSCITRSLLSGPLPSRFVQCFDPRGSASKGRALQTPALCQPSCSTRPSPFLGTTDKERSPGSPPPPPEPPPRTARGGGAPGGRRGTLLGFPPAAPFFITPRRAVNPPVR